MTKTDEPQSQPQQQQQPYQQRKNAPTEAQKDRTIFCINFEERVTEDILYELFLQAGPVESIVRKTDRNGQWIALITYKHLESVEYSIKLLNNISLFGQRLKVLPSQTQKQQGTPSTPNPYSRIYLKNARSSDNLQNFQMGGTPPSVNASATMQLQQMPPLLQQQFLYQQLMQLGNLGDLQPQQQHHHPRYREDDDNRGHQHRGSHQHHHQRHHSQNQYQNQNQQRHNNRHSQHQQQTNQYQQNRHRSDNSRNNNSRDRSRSPVERNNTRRQF